MYPWGHERRFNSYVQYFQKIFGERVQKITVDAGFSCPNRDGTISFGGCAYCNNESFNPRYCNPNQSIAWQMKEGIEFHKVRYKHHKKHLVYFQAYSNTFGSIDKLRQIYEEALGVDSVLGLVIGTRPDCVDAEKLDYIAELAQKHYIIIEYGVESCYDKTLKEINRGHTFECSRQAIIETAKRGINVGAHMLFGLPGESREEMLAEAQIISELPLSTIKFHQLQIIKGTRYEQEYLQNPSKFELFEKEEYIDFIIKFIEQMSPQIIIERFASESHPSRRLAPNWEGDRYFELVVAIEKELELRDSWQGKFFKH